VWSGDLGLDDGIPQNVYQLDQAGMTQAVDAAGAPVTVYVRPGETVELPDGLGSVTFDGLPRFVALDLRHDPSLAFVLAFALTALAGLATSLFTPRRRVWVRAVPDGEGRTVITAAALARGDDLGLVGELDRVLDALVAAGVAPADAAADELTDDGGARHAEHDRDAEHDDHDDHDDHDHAVTAPEANR